MEALLRGEPLASCFASSGASLSPRAQPRRDVHCRPPAGVDCMPLCSQRLTKMLVTRRSRRPAARAAVLKWWTRRTAQLSGRSKSTMAKTRWPTRPTSSTSPSQCQRACSLMQQQSTALPSACIAACVNQIARKRDAVVLAASQCIHLTGWMALTDPQVQAQAHRPSDASDHQRPQQEALRRPGEGRSAVGGLRWQTMLSF